MVYLFFVLASLLCTQTEALATQLKEKTDFQYLLLAHFWPTTSCVFFRNEGEDCYVSPVVKGWTIHGLWPSIAGTEKPDYCNDSMKFNYNEIKSLSSRLAVNWPSFEMGAPNTSLWEHEWTKHGTCAYSLPILKGELKYFNGTMNLHEKLNITKYLEDSGIVPSNEAMYLPQDIFNAVKKGVGKVPDITCLYEKKTQRHHLEQVWLCYNKQLQPIDCPEVSATKRLSSTLYFESVAEQEAAAPLNSYFQECPKSGKVYYKPLPNSQ
ncbi:ribonuclease T2 [Elysia marginata]|uniref:Ribonuclease T2 n=1 Tax=Elysia marginata TaxID=1093978 RepID=A0AAV4FTJ1_9GAST|nr:ribonuclease T2 [Elysia marginata]